MSRLLISRVPLVAVALTTASPSLADVTKGQCIDANTRAQTLRRGGRLTEARAALAVCGDPSCPAVVRDDCTRQVDELERAQPTILFEAKDPSGGDLAAVHVTVDGQRLAAKLDGTPLRVDPGQHVFAFEAEGRSPLTVTFVVQEAEKGRRERVVLPPVEPPEVGKEKREKPGEPSRQRNFGLLAASAGAAAVATGTVFGILASSKWSATKTECGGADDCPNYAQAAADRSATVTDATISTVGLVAGGALLAAGAYLFFTAPDGGIAPLVAPNGASLTFTGRFQ